MFTCLRKSIIEIVVIVVLGIINDPLGRFLLVIFIHDHVINDGHVVVNGSKVRVQRGLKPTANDCSVKCELGNPSVVPLVKQRLIMLDNFNACHV